MRISNIIFSAVIFFVTVVGDRVSEEDAVVDADNSVSLESSDTQKDCDIKRLNNVCKCNSQGKCEGCVESSKWGYGCDLDCPESCKKGCDFEGNCKVDPPKAECKRNSRSGKDDISNERGECAGCNRGHFGLHCANTCPKNCHPSDTEGDCTRGGKCYHCTSKYYGDTCEKACPKACPKCLKYAKSDSDGELLQPGACDQACNGDFHGADCTLNCPENCARSGGKKPSCRRGDGTCRKCNAGRYDETCELECGHCGGDKSCGQADGKCNHDCADGFWGDLCDKACPDGTVGGCRRFDGFPNDCKPGSHPAKRVNDQLVKDYSEPDTKGTETNSNLKLSEKNAMHLLGDAILSKGGLSKSVCEKCHSNCLNGQCDKKGKCPACVEGFHGDRCTIACAPNCVGGCQQSKTYCNSCADGFTGPQCENPCHATCSTCEQWGSSMSTAPGNGPTNCKSCPQEEPSSLKGGECKCDDDAFRPSKGLPCQCTQPEDKLRERVFDIEDHQCRTHCKGTHRSVVGDMRSLCIPKQLYALIIQQYYSSGESLEDTKGLHGCKEDEYGFEYESESYCFDDSEKKYLCSED